jgi:xyloglucan:xyloglucosyl transferase
MESNDLPRLIMEWCRWYVDSFPIRVFRNYASKGVPFPTKRPMFAYSSIWNADDWATQGGRVKTDWTKAPFVAEYRDISLQTCECSDAADDAACATACAASKYAAPVPCKLTDRELRQLKALQLGYTIYNYCDNARLPGKGPVPPECDMDQY